MNSIYILPIGTNVSVNTGHGGFLIGNGKIVSHCVIHSCIKAIVELLPGFWSEEKCGLKTFVSHLVCDFSSLIVDPEELTEV